MAEAGERPDPRAWLCERVAIVFPGQGSQFVGMGKTVAAASTAARAVFAQADAALGFPLSELCFAGPADRLDETSNAQPAILTTSYAAWEAINERAAAHGARVEPVVVAGHSLGQFTALVAAGSLGFAEALGLVRERGRLMREAGEERPGGMAAVLGLDVPTLEAVCAEARSAGVVVVANDNCPGQTVISGEFAAVERASELARERGAKRVARLAVSIAAHSPLMEQASVRLGALLDQLPLQTPRVPLVGNVGGRALTTVEELRADLAHHVERPVQWTRSVQAMIDAGAATFVEVGPGQVLSGLIKRISRDVKTLGLGDLGLDLSSR